MDNALNEKTEARSGADRAFFIYQRLVALFLLLLMAATYPLWIDLTSFPAVPVWSFLCDVPPIADQILAGGLVLVAATLLIAGPQGTLASRLWLTLAGVLLLTFLLNQHRFQPWAYQVAVLSCFFGLVPGSLARRLTMAVALSVYFFSAVSKLNTSFVNELGNDFLATLSSQVGMAWRPDLWSSDKWFALAFPAFELITFVLLCIPRTRKLGVVAACAMHIGLIVVLGPLGLSHSWGVLLWNVFFFAQAILLFWFPANSEEQPVEATSPWRVRSAIAICGAVVLFPLLELAGIGDPWPAWGLYASHVGRTYLFVPRHVLGSLPEEMQPYVDEQSSEDWFVPILLDRWSLETTGAPIYPGERFAFAAARSFAVKTKTVNFARLVIESPADRFSDERRAEAFAGDQISKEAQRFWLNTEPRRAYLRGN
ncbi:MauE/DoxX family redox-associated membrane protein [Bremerella cremea]|uniref:MauE/DoxX family redox-associated membrane protein n=1 Tax=Bremerella cremea TaxID=1031537 RepID=UPI0031EFD318